MFVVGAVMLHVSFGFVFHVKKSSSHKHRMSKIAPRNAMVKK